MDLKARDIQNRFYITNKNRFKYIIPNCYPMNWWESDLLCISKSDYFYEYEIKLSTQDFLADTKKIDSKGITKHYHLSVGNFYGPSNFTFIVPEGLIESRDVPEFSGLIYAYKSSPRSKVIRFKEIKKGRRLHNNKIKPEVLKRLVSNLYYRFWTEHLKH